MKHFLIALIVLLFAVPGFADDPIQKNILTNIYFDTDKSDIRETEIEKLNQAAEKIKAGSEIVILIGNADKRGKRLYNLELSQRRADAVEQHLRSLGVEGNIILAFSYGEEKPLAPPDMNPEHLQMNRRVDILSLEPKVQIIKDPYKNRIRLYAGGGPHLLHKDIHDSSHVEVSQAYNPVFGLGYSRLLTERWSLGVSGFTNLSFFLNAGFDF